MKHKNTIEVSGICIGRMKVAHELIRKHPNKETFVCASGISPSGSVHIGNFREIVTTYFVVRA